MPKEFPRSADVVLGKAPKIAPFNKEQWALAIATVLSGSQPAKPAPQIEPPPKPQITSGT